MLKFQKNILSPRHKKSLSMLKRPIEDEKEVVKGHKRVLTLQIPNSKKFEKNENLKISEKSSENDNNKVSNLELDVSPHSSSILKTSSQFKKENSPKNNFTKIQKNEKNEKSRNVRFSVDLNNIQKLSEIKLTFGISKKQHSLGPTPLKNQINLLSPKEKIIKKNRKSSVLKWSKKSIRKVSADNF